MPHGQGTGVEVLEADITMFAAEFGLTTIPDNHPEASKFSNERPFFSRVIRLGLLRWARRSHTACTILPSTNREFPPHMQPADSCHRTGQAGGNPHHAAPRRRCLSQHQFTLLLQRHLSHTTLQAGQNSREKRVLLPCGIRHADRSRSSQGCSQKMEASLERCNLHASCPRKDSWS